MKKTLRNNILAGMAMVGIMASGNLAMAQTAGAGAKGALLAGSKLTAKTAFTIGIDGHATILSVDDQINASWTNKTAPTAARRKESALLYNGAAVGGGATLNLLFGPSANQSGLVYGVNTGVDYFIQNFKSSYANHSDGYNLEYSTLLVPVLAVVGYQFSIANKLIITPKLEGGYAFKSNVMKVYDTNDRSQYADRIYNAHTWAIGLGASIGYAITNNIAINITGKWGYVGGAPYKETFSASNRQSWSAESQPEDGFIGFSYGQIGAAANFSF
ncbi:MAG: hypothetical protein QM529_07485 [Hydrotalea sp.]|nr:hypothetical protein [Hydrotalea sp.]